MRPVVGALLVLPFAVVGAIAIAAAVGPSLGLGAAAGGADDVDEEPLGAEVSDIQVSSSPYSDSCVITVRADPNATSEREGADRVVVDVSDGDRLASQSISEAAMWSGDVFPGDVTVYAVELESERVDVLASGRITDDCRLRGIDHY